MSIKHTSKSNLTRRRLLKNALFGGAASFSPAFWLSGCSKNKYGKKANIIFILLDTLRADHLPTYGYKSDITPYIHQLAQQGVVFERVIAPSSWTKTSMASIMTSRDVPDHGVQRFKDILPSELTTLAEWLSSNGYHTIGINTNPWLTELFGFESGFDIYRTYSFDSEVGTAWDVNGYALDLLKQRPREQPVFLYLHYMDIHAPYTPKPPFFSARPLDVPGHGTMSDTEIEYMYRKEGLNAQGVQERVIDLYDGQIRTIDAAIRQLFNILKEMGTFDNTIFVITSDHGESFREHGTTEHGRNLYPEVYEVPLIFFGPDHLPQNIRIGAQVRSIDIVPTLFEMADLTIPKSFKGKPLLPMRPDAIEDRLAVSVVGLNDYIPDLDYIAVVSRKHLYIRERINDIVEFYDLRSDPKAQNDLGNSHPRAHFYVKFEDTIPRQAPKQAELDQETLEQLKSLGYMQ